MSSFIILAFILTKLKLNFQIGKIIIISSHHSMMIHGLFLLHLNITQPKFHLFFFFFFFDLMF